jgi:epoxyqueuosine reductase
VFTDLELTSEPAVATDLCGSCTRCLDACPTDAFVADRILDANRCLSYLTIEYKGTPAAELLAHWDGWAFGCDVCNDVCPWNVKFASPTAVAEFGLRADPDRHASAVFEQMDEAGFSRKFADTPLARPGLARMRRNVAAAVASHAEPGNR